MIGIYKITSPSGKIYIGQSINLEKRLLQYKRLDCKEQPKLYNSFLKYGYINHVFETIEECSIQKLNERERYWQDLFNVIKKGLNCRLTKANDKSGFFSEETKLKMSNSQNGRIVSEKSKLKMSISRKGKRLGLNNPNSKIILDTNNGIFYYSVNELSKYSNFSKTYLAEMLRGKKNNKTQYIYV